MSLIKHTFDPETHKYAVKGHYVWSTSDVINMNGLSSFQGVPDSVIERASERGTALHSAIEAYESDEAPDLTEEVANYFKGYLRFKEEYGFEVAGPMERSIVYRHEGTDILIGGTPDLIGFVQGELYVLDVKSCFRQSGQMKKQKLLAWQLQTQSYKEGLEQDELFWDAEKQGLQMLRGIIHCHPECGIEERGGPRKGFEFYSFDNDFSHEWDSAVRMAQLKLSNGFKVERR